MGLWTLGQQSRNTKNPIAGILQKELGITSQQGRKILEQRQKIQTVCANLKEVIFFHRCCWRLILLSVFFFTNILIDCSIMLFLSKVSCFTRKVEGVM